MLFETNGMDENISLFISDIFGRENKDILSPKEGFLRGNMFASEYKPYKNLTYLPLKAKSEREEMLYEIMALDFAINDLNLYLDLHPDNKEVFAMFKGYVEEHKKQVKEYSKIYGPLTLNKTVGSKFNWIDSPWPWDNLGGSMYV